MWAECWDLLCWVCRSSCICRADSLNDAARFVCTGAELSNIVNEALLLTARRGGEAVGLAELLEGLSRTRYGVNGNGSSGAQTALGRRLGKWLMNSLQQQQTKAVKVATS